MADSQYPDPRYPIGTHINTTAAGLREGQDLRGQIMSFFRHTDTPTGSNWNVLAKGVGPRIRIRAVTIDNQAYRRGDHDCAAMGLVEIPKIERITIRPVKPSAPEWTNPKVA